MYRKYWKIPTITHQKTSNFQRIGQITLKCAKGDELNGIQCQKRSIWYFFLSRVIQGGEFRLSRFTVEQIIMQIIKKRIRGEEIKH